VKNRKLKRHQSQPFVDYTKYLENHPSAVGQIIFRLFFLCPPFLGGRVENIGRKEGVSCFQINLDQNPSFPLQNRGIGKCTINIFTRCRWLGGYQVEQKTFRYSCRCTRQKIANKRKCDIRATTKTHTKANGAGRERGRGTVSGIDGGFWGCGVNLLYYF